MVVMCGCSECKHTAKYSTAKYSTTICTVHKIWMCKMWAQEIKFTCIGCPVNKVPLSAMSAICPYFIKDEEWEEDE